MYGTSTVYPVSGGGHRAARKERESSVFKNDLFCPNRSQHEPLAVRREHVRNGGQAQVTLRTGKIAAVGGEAKKSQFLGS